MHVVHPEAGMRETIERSLASVDGIKVTGFGSGVEALLAIGGRMPAVVIWDVGQNDVDAARVVRALRAGRLVQNVILILLQEAGAGALTVSPDEIEDVPIFRCPENLGDLADCVSKMVR